MRYYDLGFVVLVLVWMRSWSLDLCSFIVLYPSVLFDVEDSMAQAKQRPCYSGGSEHSRLLY